MKIASFLLIAFVPFFGCDIDTGTGGGKRLTAAYRFDEVQLLARSYDDGLVLHGIRGEAVEFDGTATKWSYEYSSAGIALSYFFHATYNSLVFDSASMYLRLGSKNISHIWFDSDVALQVAEENGGRDFRVRNPNYTAEAALGEPLVPNAATCWYITYRSQQGDTSLLLIIDATTGAVSGKYPS